MLDGVPGAGPGGGGPAYGGPASCAACLLSQARLSRRTTKTTSAPPVTSRNAAIPAASQGNRAARPTTPATVRSSAVLTTMLLAGSGEVLTPARIPAFTAWLAKAVAPPVTAATA